MPGFTLVKGDATERWDLPDNHLHSIVTDPPSGIAFMGAEWDDHKGYEAKSDKGRAVHQACRLMGYEDWEAGFAAFTADWATEALRCLRPGGLTAFWALPRTSDLTLMGLRAAGFDVRDSISNYTFALHIFGSGFPKSQDTERAVAMHTCTLPGRHFARNLPDGGKRQEGDHICPATPESEPWEGFGSALKPSHEIWILAQKPLSEATIAANVLRWGTGALNINGCRVGIDPEERERIDTRSGADNGERDGIYHDGVGKREAGERFKSHEAGRWPSNLVLTHHPDCRRTGTKTVEAWACVDGCPVKSLDEQSGPTGSFSPNNGKSQKVHGTGDGATFLKEKQSGNHYGDFGGGASRFFPQFAWEPDDFLPFLYCAKASKSERNAGCESLPQRVSLVPILDSEDKRCATCGKWYPKPMRQERRPNSTCACAEPVWEVIPPKPMGNHHPTVKSRRLIQWLQRLTTPPGGTTGSPFLGSGTDAVSAIHEGFAFWGMNLPDRPGEEYWPIIEARVAHAEAKQAAPSTEQVRLF